MKTTKNKNNQKDNNIKTGKKFRNKSISGVNARNTYSEGFRIAGDAFRKPSSRPDISASVSWKEPIGDTADDIGLDSLSDSALKLKLSSLSKSSFSISTAYTKKFLPCPLNQSAG